jgi:putative aminopeptidase FrvX
MRRRCFVLLFLLATAVAAETVRFNLVDRGVVLERLHSCRDKNLDREQQLQKEFTDAGCGDAALSLDQPKHSKYGNVICTLRGSSPQEIIVGAHFDHVEAGAGAVDNWSGASLLPSLFQALAAEPRKHTFVFIGFYGEEQGLVGSRQYVHELDKASLSQIDAMVNMDTLGLSTTEIWVSHADPMLARDAIAVSKSLNLPLSGVNVERVGSTDSESFRDKRIPSITFHALTQSTLHILHTREDQLSRINEEDYYQTYHFLCAYLAYLDEVVQPRVSFK